MATTAIEEPGSAASTTSAGEVAVSAEKANHHEDPSRLKTFLGILRKFIGVADLAAIRFSLPANLLEPTPNLEYSTYLDRPETFISMGDSEDPAGRMLSILRFWFTKDLKFVKGKPCKPYNSTLGEFFRCNWIVEDNLPPMRYTSSDPGSSAASFVSTKSSNTSKVKVSFLTEQTSHHPPVSAYVIDCPEKGVRAYGFDHVAAKFTGTSVRVSAGIHNLGIFVTLKNWEEDYLLTHPTAHVGGLLRGNLSVSISDNCYVTCPKSKLKTILHYIEEGWIGKAQNRVIGVVFSYDPENDVNQQKIKDVPEKDIVARIEGNWMDKLYYTLGNQPFAKSEPKYLIIDLEPLFPVPKVVPSIDVQLPNESRRFWQHVTEAIKTKQYSQATALKHVIEDNQRQKAAERKSNGTDWNPRFFEEAVAEDSKPKLTADGEKALKGLQTEDFVLEESKEYGAF